MMDDQEQASSFRSAESIQWGSLVASLEDQCQDIFLGNDRIDENAGGDRSQNFGAVSRSAHDEPGVNLLADKRHVDYLRTANLALKTRMDVCTSTVDEIIEPSVSAHVMPVPMRQWIKCALICAGEMDGTNAAASPKYVRAAIKIAISLIDHISQDSQRFDLISGAGDLAGHIIIHVKHADSYPAAPQADLSQHLPFDSSTNVRCWDERGAQNIHEQIKPLHAIEKSRKNQMELGPASPTSTGLHDHRGTKDVDYYLNVDSAEISHPDGKSSSSNNRHSVNGETQRIFHLGLVFYELFTGVQAPRELYELTSLDGAFVSLPTLSLTNESNDPNSIHNPKRHHGPYASGEDVGVVDMAYERLKLQGIASSLCALVFNMLDSIYGVMSGGECYTDLIDIKYDLKLMLDRPLQFLQDLDTDKLSASGVPLNEIRIPTIAQLEKIQACYDKFVSGSSELCIICGESGTGKSYLGNQACNLILAKGGIVLRGKFALNKKQATPFSALYAAFDEYCDILLNEKDSVWAMCVVDSLKDTFGRDICHLLSIVPKLGKVLEERSHSNDSNIDINCRNSVERLHHLVCKFVEVIGADPKRPITIFLDDVQWCDESSRSVLERLLRQEHKCIFFIFSCRDDEMESTHPFKKMVNGACERGINRTTVEMACIERDALNIVLSDLLSLSPRVVRPLTDIVYSKTKGNTLFVLQILHSLNRDGFINLDLDRKRWTWNEEQILRMKIPDNIVTYFINDISKLPSDVQSSMHTLSMFGSSSNAKHLELLESSLNRQLIGPLHTAAAEGLVNYINGTFHFSHDRIQESSYQMVEEPERCLRHLEFGKFLMKHRDREDVDLLFIAVNQINLAGPAAISCKEDYHIMAEHNLAAGRMAMSASEFTLAFNYFDYGMSFLRKTAWKDHYELSLQLHELAAQCTLAKGNTDQEELRILSHKILTHAKCLQDKLDIYYTIITSLSYASKIGGALEQSLDILYQLGVDIKSKDQSALEHYFKEMRSLVEDISEKEVVNLMTDRTKLMTMKFLSKLVYMAAVVRPMLLPRVAIKMIDMTIQDGVAPSSAVGFAYTAGMFATLGHKKDARRCASLATSFLDKGDTTEFKGGVLSLLSEVQAYLEPLQSANELRVKGEQASISAGDMHAACINRLQCMMSLFWSGVQLSTVCSKMSQAIDFFKSLGHQMITVYMMDVQEMILILMGTDTGEFSLPDTGMMTERKNLYLRQSVSIFYSVYVSFFLKPQDLKRLCQEYYEAESAAQSYFTCTYDYSDSARAFIVGLAAFQLYRETKDETWLDRGRVQTKGMEHWATKGCAWNFEHKRALLQAEEYYCDGNIERAKGEFSNSITSAREHKFLNDEALAYQLAAQFYLNIGDMESSREHFKLAHEKFLEWGATKKAELLLASAKEHFDLGDFVDVF